MRVIQALSGNMAFVQPLHSQGCLVAEPSAPPSILVIPFEQSLKSSARMPVDSDQQNTLDLPLLDPLARARCRRASRTLLTENSRTSILAYLARLALSNDCGKNARPFSFHVVRREAVERSVTT